MKKSITIVATGVAAVALPLESLAGAAPKQTPKNIILIMTDQQSAAAMSCAGNPWLKTPGMDRLSQHGVRFTNAYCTAPLSGPSRTAMYTGCYPDEVGMIRNGAPLRDSLKSTTLGSLVRASGYECAYAGKWHVSESSIPDEVYGFKRIYEHNDLGLAERVVEYLQQRHSHPFFLVASFDNPHNICEYAREQNLPWGEVPAPRSIEDCPPLPDNFARNADDADVTLMERDANYSVYPTVRYTADQWRRYRYTYYRLVERVDAQIGKIVDELDRQHLWDESIVIFTSDHGDGTGAHHWNQKSALYEEVVNIPLILCDPAAPEGEISDRIVSNGVDLFETIIDYVGGVSPRHNGVSFRTGRPERQYAVCETTFDGGTTRGWMLRTEHYKYVLYDKGPYREQLFKMPSDRGETHNLAYDEDYQEVLWQHRDILYEWMRSNHVRTSRPIICDVPGKPLYNN